MYRVKGILCNILLTFINFVWVKILLISAYWKWKVCFLDRISFNTVIRIHYKSIYYWQNVTEAKLFCKMINLYEIYNKFFKSMLQIPKTMVLHKMANQFILANCNSNPVGKATPNPPGKHRIVGCNFLCTFYLFYIPPSFPPLWVHSKCQKRFIKSAVFPWHQSLGDKSPLWQKPPWTLLTNNAPSLNRDCYLAYIINLNFSVSRAFVNKHYLKYVDKFKFKHNESDDFRVTHQATANRWSLSTHMVSVVAQCFVFLGPMLAL